MPSGNFSGPIPNPCVLRHHAMLWGLLYPILLMGKKFLPSQDVQLFFWDLAKVHTLVFVIRLTQQVNIVNESLLRGPQQSTACRTCTNTKA